MGDLDVQAAREALVEFDRAFELSDKYPVGMNLQLAAKVALVANEIDKARQYANLMVDGDPHGSRDRGDHVLNGNTTLGNLALAQGDIHGAAWYPLLGAATPGSSRLNGMGSDLTPAEGLLENGEQESVLQSFELCARFWERGPDRLCDWLVEVRVGNTPSFRPYWRHNPGCWMRC